MNLRDILEDIGAFLIGGFVIVGSLALLCSFYAVIVLIVVGIPVGVFVWAVKQFFP